MKDLFVFLALSCVIWLAGIFFKRKPLENCQFMSISHTNICRAVAAIIIILQHVAGGFGVRYFTPLGGIGVAMFLILSGYGLNESYKRKKTEGYWKTKIIRVLIPYLIVSIVVTSVEFLCGSKVEIPYYWYLDFILFWYIIFYLIIKVPRLYTKRYWILGIAGIVIFITCSGLRAEQAISFLIGIWISDNYEKARKTFTNNGVLVILMITGIVFLMMKQIPTIRIQGGETLLWKSIQFVMKLSFAMAFIGLAYRFRMLFNNGFIVFAGKISYELYLVHYRLLSLPQKGIRGMCAFLGLSIVGAWIINKISSYIKKKVC